MATRKPKRAPSRARARKSTRTKSRPARRGAGTARPRRNERRRQERETLRLRSIGPGLTANDLQRSIAFYTDVLGFVVGERWEEDGKLLGVMLKAGSCTLALSQDDWKKGRDRKKGEGFRIHCETVQDIDALAERIKSAGARLTEEPADQPWGVRSLSIDDPDGFHITVSRKL
jgi:uncharacterized glyoxalase superfamily protein PhnB